MADSNKKIVCVEQLERALGGVIELHDKDIKDVSEAATEAINAILELDSEIDQRLDNKSFRFVTQEEYDNLTEEDLNEENIVWCIEDELGSSFIQDVLTKEIEELNTSNKTVVNSINELSDNIPNIISEKELVRIPASTLVVNIGGEFEIDFVNFDENKCYLYEYNGIRSYTDKIEVDYQGCKSIGFGEYYTGEIRGSINSGYNINWDKDATKAVVIIQVLKDNTNLSDLVIKELEINHLNNLLLDHDLEIENSISIGRKVSSSIGEHSFAVGDGVEASGNYSHAEGYYSLAQGDRSHAEGTQTIAEGNNSHAEGQNTYAGHCAHAEGDGTVAEQFGAHAEGQNTYAGMYAHAEGVESRAEGNVSHAEGKGVIAQGRYQHAQGKYNVPLGNDYAHVVGSGNSDEDRKNAHTLDWDGNAWFQGNVSVDGTPTNDNDLVTKKYVDNIKTPCDCEWVTICENVSSEYMEGTKCVFPNIKIEPHAHIEFALDVTDINGTNRIIEFLEGEIKFDFYDSQNQKIYMSAYSYDENYDLTKDAVDLEVCCFDEKDIKIIIYAQDTEWEDLTINKIVYLRQLQSKNKITDLEIDEISYFKITNQPNWMSLYDEGMLGILRSNYVEALINRSHSPVKPNRDNVVSPFTDTITASIYDGFSGPMNSNIISIENAIYSDDVRNAVGFSFVAEKTSAYSSIRVFAENAIVTITDGTGQILEENKNKKILLKNFPCSLIEGNTYYVLFSNEDGSEISVPKTLPFIVSYGEGLNDLTKIMYMDNTFSYTPTEDYHPATKKYVDDIVADATPAIINETTIAVITADEIQAAIDITEGGGGTLGAYLYFEIDNPDLEVGESLFIEYGGYTFRTKCPPNGYQSNMYCVDIVVYDNSDSFVVPEGQMMLFIKRGFNKNGEADETKCRVACNLDQFNVTDMVIQHKTIKSMDNLLLGEDVNIINSLSMGRANNTAIGTNSVALGEHAEASLGYSIALGNDVHAQGVASVSLGQQNISSGNASFTSGYGNIASANYSTAEGRFNKATGTYTHVEGYKNEARGTCSHAEGSWTLASGSYSHAEGLGSQAKGDQSHAEGQDTIAASTNQHVQGKFNIEDGSQTYAHIVGNGTSKEVRSNAHTLDWDGNAWFQGNVSIDGTPTNDNDLVTKQYVDDNKFSGDYNDLENKPCYEEIIEVDEITFDGIVKDTDEIVGGFYLKVTNEPAQIDEFIGKTMKIKNKDTEEETTKIIDSSLIQEVTPDTLYVIDDKIAVIYDTIEFDLESVFDKGIYFLLPSDYSSEYVSYLGISATLQKIKRLDEKFLPNLVGECTVGKTFTVYDNIEDMKNNINGISVVAGENAEIFNSKDNIAVGSCSHAEGEGTIANGYVAHAEGFECVANKNFSHAEGMSTFANGYVSHTEGDETVTNGRCAHAEGQGTIASGDNQHVQGQFNVEDTENKYAHIVGGGRSWGEIVDGEEIIIIEPKNIHTLDWDGNAWFQGNVSVDGTPTNDKDLATKKYVDESIAQASIGGEVDTTLFALKSELFSKDYNDLTNKPEIPSIEGLASETYVNNAIAGLVDSAPETLNTLNELAQALGDDPNFATTVSTEIGKKANSEDLATVATSGSYNDLIDKPDLTKVNALQLNGYSLWVGTTDELNGITERDENTIYFEIDNTEDSESSIDADEIITNIFGSDYII